ncbi:MFS transporter [Allostella vacuolata]|nr:MFS transporter [Stella vacuolata]
MTELGERPGGPRALLADRDYLRLWLVGGFANAVRWLELLAAGVFAYDLTGSGLVVAAMTAARMLPMLLVGALAGAVADAVNRRTLLLAGQAATAASASIVCLLALLDLVTLWHIAAAGTVSGIVWAGEMAVRRRMVSEVAGPTRIGPAIALDTVTNSVTRMAGPVLGGLLLEKVGIAGVYFLSALLYFLGFVLVLGLRYSQEARPLRILQIPGDIAAGFAVARKSELILAILATTVVMNAFGFAYTAMIPPIGRQEFGVSPTLVGVLASAEAGGSLLGGLLLASGRLTLARGRLFIAGAFGLMMAVALAALAPWYMLAFFLLLLGGFGTCSFASMQSTLILTEAPPEMRSRLMGIVTVCIGTGPVGVLAVGALSDVIGPRQAMLAMALAGLAGLAAIYLRWPALRR